MGASEIDKLLQNFQRKLRIFEEQTNIACGNSSNCNSNQVQHCSKDDSEYFDLDESLKNGYLPCTRFKLRFRHVKRKLKMAVANGQTLSSESEDGLCIQQAIINAKQRMMNLVHEETNFKKDIKEIQGIFYNLIAELDRLDQGETIDLQPSGARGETSQPTDDGRMSSSYRNNNSLCGSENQNDSRTSVSTTRRRRNSLKMGQRAIQSPMKSGASTTTSSSSSTSDCDTSSGGSFARQRSGVRLGTSIAKRRNSFNSSHNAAKPSLPPAKPAVKPRAVTSLNRTYVIDATDSSPKKPAAQETTIDYTFSPQLTSTMVHNSPNVSLMGFSGAPSSASQITTADSSYDSDNNTVPGRASAQRNNLYKLHMQRMRRTPITSPIRTGDAHSPGILKSSPAEKLYKKKSATQNKRRDTASHNNTSHNNTSQYHTSRNSIVSESLPPKTPVKSPRVTFVDEVYKLVNTRTSTSSESSSEPESDYTTAYKPVPVPQLNPIQKTSSAPMMTSLRENRDRAQTDSSTSSSNFSSDSSCSKCTTIDRTMANVPHPTPEDTIDDSSFMQPPRQCFNTPNSTYSTTWDSSDCTSVLTEVGLALEACDESNSDDVLDDLDHIEKEFRKCRDNAEELHADETYSKYVKLIDDFERQLIRNTCGDGGIAAKSIGKSHHCQNHDVHMALGEPCSLYLEETLTLLESSKFNMAADQLSESGFESTHNVDSSLDSTLVTDASSIEGSAKGSFRQRGSNVDMRRMLGMMQYARKMHQQQQRKCTAIENKRQTRPNPIEHCQKLSLPAMTRPRIPESLEVTINSTPDMSAVKSSPETDSNDCCLLDAEHTMMEHNFQSIHGRDYCESLSSGSSDSISTTMTEARLHIPTNTPVSSYEPSPEYSPQKLHRFEVKTSPTSTPVSSYDSRLRTRSRKNPPPRKNVVSNASYQNAISGHPCATPGLSPIASTTSGNSSDPRNPVPMNTPIGSQETTPAKDVPPQTFNPGSVRSANSRRLRKQLKFNTPKFKSPLKSRKKKYHVSDRNANPEADRMPKRAISMKAKKVKDSLYLARHNRRKSDVALPPPVHHAIESVDPAEMTAEEKELAYKKKKGLKKKLKMFSNYFHRKDRDAFPELQTLAQL